MHAPHVARVQGQDHICMHPTWHGCRARTDPPQPCTYTCEGMSMGLAARVLCCHPPRSFMSTTQMARLDAGAVHPKVVSAVSVL